MQAVFKPLHASTSSSRPPKVKLAISRHTPVFCVYCERVNLPEEDAYKTCSGCRAVRYCSREHQATHWPAHKAICRSQTALLATSTSSPYTSESGTKLSENGRTPFPTIPQRTQIEDFVRLHHYILSRILCTAIFSSHSPSTQLRKSAKLSTRGFDFRKQIAIITLSPRIGTTNPAKAFSLTGIQFETIPPEGSEMGDTIAPLRRGMEIADTEDRKNPDYFGLLLCNYHIPEWNLHWTSPRSLFISDLYTTPNADWWKVAKFYLDTGIVYRLVPQATVDFNTIGVASLKEKAPLQWRPGTLVRSKHNWVWMDGNFDVVRKELEASGLTKDFDI
ncbi:hypothetical protein BDQ17DRAFT_1422286 [Cyathus striatus]|nr:hypothetical protein BDQ17DRAFT_1422286 [Cyathus striatus]